MKCLGGVCLTEFGVCVGSVISACTEDCYSWRSCCLLESRRSLSFPEGPSFGKLIGLDCEFASSERNASAKIQDLQSLSMRFQY